MKYALFALGLLLLFLGGYAVYTGSGIIEVERGWSSVIAGTTAFVGGLLTLGIAWIIKTLEQIRAAIETRESLAVNGAVPQRHVAGEDFANPPALPIAPIAWPPHTVSAHAAAEEESTFDDLRATQAELGLHAGSFEHGFYGTIAAEPEETLHRATRDHPNITEPVKTSPSIKELWRRVAKEIDTTVSATRLAKEQHAAPPPLVAATPPAPPIGQESLPPTAEHRDAEGAVTDAGDWLDQAFANLDVALGETPILMHPANVLANEAREATETAPPHPAPPPQGDLPTAAQAEPAVIGRYEAEGTSYVMFADGSIEAQSDRGVARFRSMADLKAYFETQETP